jgi:hypothetical protein
VDDIGEGDEGEAAEAARGVAPLAVLADEKVEDAGVANFSARRLMRSASVELLLLLLPATWTVFPAGVKVEGEVEENEADADADAAGGVDDMV